MSRRELTLYSNCLNDNLHISIDKKDTPTHSVVTTHTVICILTYNVNTSILHVYSYIVY